MLKVSIIAASWVFTYMAYAFIGLEVNPLHWSEGQRFAYVVIVLLAALAIITYPDD